MTTGHGARHLTVPLRTVVALVAGLALLGGCAASSTAGRGGTGGPGTVPSSSTPSGSPLPAGPGMRGVPVDAIDCVHPVTPDDSAVAVLPGVPVRLVLCPLPVMMPTDGASHRVELSPVPVILRQVLALPDTPPPSGQVACPAYADVPQTLYATLADGRTYLVHIPHDACGHYLRSVLEVVQRYRGSLTPAG